MLVDVAEACSFTMREVWLLGGTALVISGWSRLRARSCEVMADGKVCVDWSDSGGDSRCQIRCADDISPYYNRMCEEGRWPSLLGLSAKVKQGNQAWTRTVKSSRTGEIPKNYFSA